MGVKFRPKLTGDLGDFFTGRFDDKKVFENTTLFGRISSLVDLVHPEKAPDKGSGSTWLNLYVPVREQTGTYTYKARIDQSEDGKTYRVQIDYGYGLEFDVTEGSQRISRKIFHIPTDVTKLLSRIKQKGAGALNVPYSQRRGTVKSAYVLDHIISPDERADIESRYGRHIAEMEELHEVSLNGYLEVAAMLCRVTNPDLANLSPEQLHRKSYGSGGSKWDIEDWDSAEQFMDWVKNKIGQGEHTFTFGGLLTSLTPPSEITPYFTFRSGTLNPRTNLAILNVLMHNKVVFRVDNLDQDLDLFEGKTDLRVNGGYWRTTPQCHGAEGCTYFDAIRWDPLPLPILK